MKSEKLFDYLINKLTINPLCIINQKTILSELLKTRTFSSPLNLKYSVSLQKSAPKPEILLFSFPEFHSGLQIVDYYRVMLYIFYLLSVNYLLYHYFRTGHFLNKKRIDSDESILFFILIL